MIRLLTHLALLLFAGGVYLLQLFLADTLLGSSDILFQWSYGSKRQLLEGVLLHCFFAGLFLLIAYTMIVLGYKGRQRIGHVLVAIAILSYLPLTGFHWQTTVMLSTSLLITLILNRRIFR